MNPNHPIFIILTVVVAGLIGAAVTFAYTGPYVKGYEQMKAVAEDALAEVRRVDDISEIAIKELNECLATQP